MVLDSQRSIFNMNKKVTSACFIGITLEWYEFGLFGAFAPVIAKVFFPEDSSSIALMKTFVIFGVGFVLRPVAAVCWGYFGDKYGRKTAGLWSMLFIGVSTVAIGLIPGYLTIGYWAPFLLLVVRVFQGFSISGEHGPMIAYLYEESGNKAMASIGMCALYFGLALGVVAEVLTRWFFSESIFYDWGWRIPFIVGGLISIIGILLRKNMQESASFLHYLSKSEKQSWLNLLLDIRGKLFLGIGVCQLAFILPYIVFIYFLAHQSEERELSFQLVFLSTFISLLFTSLAVMTFSLIAEKYGRLKILAGGVTATILLSWILLPELFYGDIGKLFIAQLIFGLLISSQIGPFCAYYASQFTVAIRCSAISICLNLISAAFGGLTPFVMSYIFLNTMQPIAILSYLIASSALLALICLWVLYKKEKRIESSYSVYEATGH